MTTRVLFVCLGNICRSPMAEGLLRVHGPDLIVDSAGTGAWHIGNPPDPRAVAEAGRHGVDISGQRARQVGAADFSLFDLILAMDASTQAALERLRPQGSQTPVRLMRAYDPEGTGRDVPDPYYDDRFSDVWTILDRCVSALAEGR